LTFTRNKRPIIRTRCKAQHYKLLIIQETTSPNFMPKHPFVKRSKFLTNYLTKPTAAQAFQTVNLKVYSSL
jgi:hypothetical protein